MSNIKDREREELHKTIWKIANELRGSVDGWDFKQYILGIMFYRYISENITKYINDLKDVQYVTDATRDELVGLRDALDTVKTPMELCEIL